MPSIKRGKDFCHFPSLLFKRGHADPNFVLADDKADVAADSDANADGTPARRDLRDRSQLTKASYVSVSDRRASGPRSGGSHAATRCVGRCVRANPSVATCNQPVSGSGHDAVASSSPCAYYHKVRTLTPVLFLFLPVFTA